MRLLLDTHIVLAIVNNTVDGLPQPHRELLSDLDSDLFCSVASLWEIAIKVRLGKLSVAGSLGDLEQTCRAFNLEVSAITSHHVLAEAIPPPATRDPFDRLLLAQASVEGMRLVTLDRALAAHALALAPTTP